MSLICYNSGLQTISWLPYHPPINYNIYCYYADSGYVYSVGSLVVWELNTKLPSFGISIYIFWLNSHCQIKSRWTMDGSGYKHWFKMCLSVTAIFWSFILFVFLICQVNCSRKTDCCGVLVVHNYRYYHYNQHYIRQSSQENCLKNREVLPEYSAAKWQWWWWSGVFRGTRVPGWHTVDTGTGWWVEGESARWQWCNAV